jgi:hypothetical protein
MQAVGGSHRDEIAGTQIAGKRRLTALMFLLQPEVISAAAAY